MIINMLKIEKMISILKVNFFGTPCVFLHVYFPLCIYPHPLEQKLTQEPNPGKKYSNLNLKKVSWGLLYETRHKTIGGQFLTPSETLVVFFFYQRRSVGAPLQTHVMILTKGGQLGPPVSHVTFFNLRRLAGPLPMNTSHSFNQGRSVGAPCETRHVFNQKKVRSNMRRDVGKPLNVLARNVSWPDGPRT